MSKEAKLSEFSRSMPQSSVPSAKTAQLEAKNACLEAMDATLDAETRRLRMEYELLIER